MSFFYFKFEQGPFYYVTIADKVIKQLIIKFLYVHHWDNIIIFLTLGPRECIPGKNIEPGNPGNDSTTPPVTLATSTTTTSTTITSTPTTTTNTITTPSLPSNEDHILVLPLPTSEKVQEISDYQDQYKTKKRSGKHSSSETFNLRPGVNFTYILQAAFCTKVFQTVIATV